jgi:hypothetical protein
MRWRTYNGRQGAPRSASTELALPVLMTEQGAQVSHFVTDLEAAAPLRDADPRALCGRAFVPATLTTPPGPTCPACLDRMRPPTPTRTSRWRRQRPAPTDATSTEILRLGAP